MIEVLKKQNNKVALLNKNASIYYFDGRMIDLNAFKYVEDAGMRTIFEAHETILNESFIRTGIETLGKAVSTATEISVDFVVDKLKKALPETPEEWVHFSVDSVALLADLLGPFTGGIGFAVSSIIDVMHGMYYFSKVEDGWDERDDGKMITNSILGVVTMGAGLIPGTGNALSISAKRSINFAAKRGGTRAILKVLKGIGLSKPIKWFFSNIGSIATKITNFLNKLTGSVLFETLLKKTGMLKIAKSSISGIEKGIVKMLTSKDAVKWLTKNGVNRNTLKSLSNKFAKYLTKEQKELVAKNLGVQAVKGSKISQKLLKGLPKGVKLTDEMLSKSAVEVSKKLLKGRIRQRVRKGLALGLVPNWISWIEETLNSWGFTNFATNTPLAETKRTVFNKAVEMAAFFIPKDERNIADSDVHVEIYKRIQEYLNETKDLYGFSEEIKIDGILGIVTYSRFQDFLYHWSIKDSSDEKLSKISDIANQALEMMYEVDKTILEEAMEMTEE